MEKVNLKGKLVLKKEVLSKLDMTNISGGQTGQNICAQTVFPCTSIVQTIPANCNITVKKSICIQCQITTTISIQTGP